MVKSHLSYQDALKRGFKGGGFQDVGRMEVECRNARVNFSKPEITRLHSVERRVPLSRLGNSGVGKDTQSAIHCSLQEVFARLMELQGIVEELLVCECELNDSRPKKFTSLGPLVCTSPKS